jgi:hypothetical protein
VLEGVPIVWEGKGCPDKRRIDRGGDGGIISHIEAEGNQISFIGGISVKVSKKVVISDQGRREKEGVLRWIRARCRRTRKKRQMECL